MSSAARPDFLTPDAFRSLLPPNSSPFMISLVESCFESENVPLNDRLWDFPLRTHHHPLNANELVRQLRFRPVSIAMRAIEPTLIDVCQPFETFESAIYAAQILFTRFATITLSLSRYTERLMPILRPIGMIAEMTAREGNLPLLLESNLVILRHIMSDDPSVRAALEAGQLPSEGVYFDAWRINMERYGYRAENETDLAAPRYAEQPEKWIQAILSPETAEQFGAFPRRSLWGVITFPIWQVALRYLYARENFRNSMMFAFAHLRNELLRLATQAAERGQIEGESDIWGMTVGDVIALDAGKTEDA